MSGPYGRVYKSLRTHPKWCGGMHGDADLKRLSWPAKGLWVELVSLSVGRPGKFSMGDLDNLRGVKAEWLEELVTNGLVDRDGDLYRLHDFSDHAMTPEKWERTKKLAADRQAKKRSVTTEPVTGDVTKENGGSHGEVTRDITREFLSLPLRSDQEISEPPTVPAESPPPRPGTARRWTLLASRARLAVEAACRDRRCGLPAQCSEPDHNDWCKLAKWAESVERVRAADDALSAETALDFAMTEWLTSDAPSVGFSPHWFADNANKYFITEAIQARAKRREVAA